MKSFPKTLKGFNSQISIIEQELDENEAAWEAAYETSRQPREIQNRSYWERKFLRFARKSEKLQKKLDALWSAVAPLLQ